MNERIENFWFKFWEDNRLNSHSRKREHIYPRIIVAKIMRDEGHNLGEIGWIVGKKHTTVSHYLKQYENLMKYKDFKEILEFVKNGIKQDT